MKTGWYKSEKSSNNGSCVEINGTDEPGSVLVRHSLAGDGSPALTFTSTEWEAFIDGAKKGEFDVA